MQVQAEQREPACQDPTEMFSTQPSTFAAPTLNGIWVKYYYKQRLFSIPATLDHGKTSAVASLCRHDFQSGKGDGTKGCIQNGGFSYPFSCERAKSATRALELKCFC